MKSKFLSVFFAALLCLSLIVPASAEPADAHFVIDEIGVLTVDEYNELKEYAAGIYEDTGVGIFYGYVLVENLADFDITLLTGGMEDCVIMLENTTHWMLYRGGKGLQLDSAEDALRAVYDGESTYAGGVRAYMSAAALYFAGETVPDVAPAPIGPELPSALDAPVIDKADLLSDAEEMVLEQKLAALGDAYGVQVVVCALASLEGQSIDAYQHTLFDELNLGYGDNHDGILLLLGMDVREYRILSNGFAGVAVDGSVIDSIGAVITPDLSAGNYAAAFDAFADQCDYYLNGYLNGFAFDFVKNLAIALVVGVVAGLIVAFVLRGQLKTVRKQNQANVYVKPGSMQVVFSRDTFLHRHVSRTRKESKSSSGSSRSSGGGSF